MVAKIRTRKRLAKRVRVGAPDGSLTAVAGLVAVRELTDRLVVIGAVDAAVGPIKSRARGYGAGALLVGIAAAQLAGEDFLVGLDRQRGDTAGQSLAPVPGLAASTACGLARRIDASGWLRVEAGIAAVHARMLALLPAPPREALCVGATIDLDATDMEVYGRKKRGVAYNYLGQRCGRPHVAAWAQTGSVLAADLLAGDVDPRSHACALLVRAGISWEGRSVARIGLVGADSLPRPSGSAPEQAVYSAASHHILRGWRSPVIGWSVGP